MRRRKWFWIECAIIAGIILGLGWFSVPRFLQSQTRKIIADIRFDLQPVVDALQTYMADYPELHSDMHGIRNRFIFPQASEQKPNPQLFQGGFYQGHVGFVFASIQMVNMPEFRSNLMEAGYLENVSARFFTNENKNAPFFIFSTHSAGNDPANSFSGVGAAVSWPLEHFIATAEIKSTSTMQPWFVKNAIDSDMLFEASNGLQSKGLIFVSPNQ